MAQTRNSDGDCSPCEWLSVAINIASALLVAGGVVFAAYQTQAQSEALRSSAYTSVMDKQMEINKILLDKPYLQSYFFDNKNPTVEKDKCDEKDSNNKTIDCYRESLALADYYLDFFDLFYSQRETILTTGSKESEKTCIAWENYIADRLKNSPILRERLSTASESRWYTTEFIENLQQKLDSSSNELEQQVNNECNYYGIHQNH